MHLAFDIFQGIGIAAAAGIRPFLPTLAVGALAAGDAEIHFNGTGYAFLQSAPFLIALAVLTVALVLVARRVSAEPRPRSPLAVAVAGAGIALGALMFAGSLARGHYVSWPGLIGGAACALVAIAATWPLLARVRARLESSTAATLPLYSEAAAVALAVLSVLLPPVGILGLLLMLWLLVAGRRRADQKYAGLRILR